MVLVGKGITFDSGGLSIKPGQSMVTMKRDMTGAAVVAAVMAALPDVGCPIRVTGLLPMAENAVSGTSMRPGDVITQYGGRTTEVTNTDAEGRLVLADGLAYAVDKLDPDVLVDIATLTGAHEGGPRPAHRRAVRQRRRPCRPPRRVRCPRRGAGVADAAERGVRVQALLQGGRRRQRPGGPAVRSRRRCSSSTSSVGLPWAHLDIASVGDAPKDHYEWTEGPTGFGARLLLDWLGQPDPLAGVGS